MSTDTAAPRTPYRVRHDTRFRLLEVARVEDVTPAMRRITLRGEALEGFRSDSFNDHVKLFFPAPGEREPVVPTPSPNGPVFPEGQPRPVARDYTPRRFDAAAGELVLDFALHDNGPATEWASRARPGDRLGVGGPRGSFVIPADYDWHLLIGDETALPAIGRRLEELPANARAIVLAEVASAAEEQRFRSLARTEIHWIHRGEAAAGSSTGMEEALAAFTLPDGEGFAWVACESEVARRLRAILLEQHALPKGRVKAAGYWKRGAVAAHENLDD
ncbi:siderophore-interacting protein [Roseomonas elaeocarpi]|uniref:Siderophore-interacting protein n=1 Tax=Roseomonas elaeocarpi TaxID=907779 RepID=A0ABV6JVZ0_9PROT